jgi:DNA-binding MarR family transcriptional regulator
MTDLKTEIKQTKPFGSLQEEAHLNIVRTAAMLSHAFNEAIRGRGITGTQYNALRVLRGAGEKGLCRNEVRDRLVAQVPDASRLLDRLERMGLIERQRQDGDRRYVTTRITPAGRQLLAELDGPVCQLHRAQIDAATDEELRTVVSVLERIRGRLQTV